MKKIEGQVIYVGPHIIGVGLQHGTIFRDGILNHLYDVIEKCPSLGDLFVPVAEYGKVRRELDFDFARNMRGTTGKFVTLYRDVQKWLAPRAEQQPTMKVTTHA